MKYDLILPAKQEEVKQLKIGDIVYLNGILITARDQVHKRIVDFIKDLPIDFLETRSNRILKETEMFPFVELLPIILEILISQDLHDHQVYFCLKILRNLFKLDYTIENMENMFEVDNEISQADLDEMAKIVISNKWHIKGD